MHVITCNYNGNPNIGLFCYANDHYCLVPVGFNKKLKTKFEEVFKVPIYEVRAAGTSLLGVFFNGNNNMLLVPEIMFDSELKQLDKFKIKYKIVKSELTALGNNLLINDNIVLASTEYKDEVLKDIEKQIKLKVKKSKIADLDIVGSLAVMNDKGCLATPDIEEFEKKFLEKNLKVKITTGSVNFGSPYVSSGIVCNKNGFVVGDASGGPEIQNADEALGFLGGDE